MRKKPPHYDLFVAVNQSAAGSSVTLILPFPFFRASDRGTEEEGDEGITWTLVKQLNGPSKEGERGKKARGKEGIQYELSG